jgi:hypothetical protein
MTPIESLQISLTSLGLKAVEARLENILEQAAQKAPGYAEFLDQVLGCEVEARRTRYLRARLQRHTKGPQTRFNEPNDSPKHFIYLLFRR